MCAEPVQNHLKREKSPYLQQHRYNPVDWYPWGEEAFEKARREDKAIFLSIGYSTCHWCHVMAHESFEDPEVAELMNAAFVNIKVDREERPDIDHIYMTVCQMMTGSGGWPLTLVMTPDQRPFFAGTYFPKHSRYGRIGILDLVTRLKQLWSEERGRVEASAAQITQLLHDDPELKGGATQQDEAVDLDLLNRAYRELSEHFDPLYGGFREAPKFPSPHNLLFLLRYWRRTGEPQALEMVSKTLTQMRLGGIFDQVGWGFHRYATDAHWFLPHFEKMLYDQALLLMAYTEAWQATQTELFRQTAAEIVAYVLRDLRAPGGAFYAAEDADSEGEEGKFYVWTETELQELLTASDLDLLRQIYGVQEQGNVYEEASGKQTGSNHFAFTRPPEQWALELGLSEADLQARLEAVRQILFARRESRVRPHLDRKILTDWNGLMIAALAQAARVFQRSDWLQAACEAADFVQAHLRAENGLQHRYCDGEAAIAGHLDDYVFLAWAELELYQAGLQPQALARGLDLIETILQHFGDPQQGGFYFTDARASKLIVRKKEFYDGAVPSGNAVLLHLLSRYYHLTAREALREAAEHLVQALGPALVRVPLAYLHFIAGLEWLLASPRELVLAVPFSEQESWLAVLREHYLPLTVWHCHDGTQRELLRLVPPLTEQGLQAGQAVAYLCQGFVCQAPLPDPSALHAALQHRV